MKKQLFRHKHSLIVILSISICIVFLTTCIGNGKKEGNGKDVEVNQFAGSQSCAGCHKDIFERHSNTSHYLTSRPAFEKFIKGSFSSDSNSFAFDNRFKIKMEKREDNFFQIAYQDGIERRRMQFDITIGSGTKGQGYLNWVGNSLLQLPISYFSLAHQWSNSPGKSTNVPFSRPITSRCLECHSTYFHKISEQHKTPEEFDRQNIVYGVDCEKCHGPASKHVSYQLANPGDTIAKYITNPASLSRQQNLDLCALCHGGRLNKTKSSFTFQAGDKLADYFSMDTAERNMQGIDVHGNQLGLLAGSKCYTLSQMTCTSCHNVHENERGKLSLFSSRCLNCHSSNHGKVCKLSDKGIAIDQNCIDCHMPKEPSMSIVVFLQGAEIPTPAIMRTHLIKIYPGETKKVLANLSQLQKDKLPAPPAKEQKAE